MPEILPGIHLVEGVDPSPDFSTHVYLIREKGGAWTLIDTGLPGASTAILAYLAKLKVEPTAVKKILITHLHRDHTGSLRAMIEKTRARTFAHWIEAAGWAAFGSASEVAERLRAFASTGIDELLGIFDFGGLSPEEVSRSVRDLGAEWARTRRGAEST